MFLKKPAGVRWLVVFLGNPGLTYVNTRHNAGFMTADVMARSLGVTINRSRFQALTATCTIGDEPVMLMKPQTFMNLSGEAVAPAARFYKIPPERILVVSDEISLPIGRIRVRPKGSAGGHNGLKNIIACLGSDQFPRVRLGVGAPPHPDFDMKDWVLASFQGQDAEYMARAVKKAAEAVESYITLGAEPTMNRFNSK